MKISFQMSTALSGSFFELAFIHREKKIKSINAIRASQVRKGFFLFFFLILYKTN